jgi:hypothetical protein
MTVNTTDVDIDFADREQILHHIKSTAASIRKNDQVKRHNSGVYVTDCPYDPINDMASIDYELAESRGYIKLDLLNVWLYKYVRDELHLVELMREPDWSQLQDRKFFEKLIHISRHYNTMQRMPEPIDTIPRLAMFLSVIRPGKKHLIGETWKQVAATVWDRNDDGGYVFRKSHAIAYAQLVVVHMNLLAENSEASQIVGND